ncbi:Ger(x)C family spore germination protein [Paenibacillus piri]|uniref:Ger(X)C family spore germination protein n=1 Tax=Paenibacillus piri TaxID=2547395 RepID=A0A4R5KX11_9BACL|nr:Ger(x)C family spore germination protein [Paenibacillus piri]TDG00357.1 Ger(x)C family spore germination protein [Paenibacillus piri]
MKQVAGGLLLLLISVLLSGCWSRHELNDISIVVGMGIDYIGDKYKVTVQTVNPGQVAVKRGTSFNASPVVTFEEMGATIPEALSRMTVRAPRHLYYAHLRMVILGESTARAGIGKSLDFLSRNMEMRTDFYFVVARKTSASEILKMNSAMDPIPANNMYTKLETSDKYWSATGSMNLNTLLQDMGMAGKDPTMTGIEIAGDPRKGDKTSNSQYIDPPVILKYAGMAAFKFDRMVGWLDENDTKALNYIQNSVHQTTGVIPCSGGKGKISMQVIRSNAVITPTLRNGKPEFDVHIRLEQDISDVECMMDLSKASVVNELKRWSDLKVHGLLEKSLQKIQKEYGTDIYGFGNRLHNKYPQVWHEIKNWNEVFPTVPIRIHVNTILRRMGTVLQPMDALMEK